MVLNRHIMLLIKLNYLLFGGGGIFFSKVAENHLLLSYGIWGSEVLNFLVTLNGVLCLKSLLRMSLVTTCFSSPDTTFGDILDPYPLKLERLGSECSGPGRRSYCRISELEFELTDLEWHWETCIWKQKTGVGFRRRRVSHSPVRHARPQAPQGSHLGPGPLDRSGHRRRRASQCSAIYLNTIWELPGWERGTRKKNCIQVNK